MTMFAQPGFETQLRQFTESQNNRRQSLHRNFEVRLFCAHLHTLKTIMEHPYWIFYCELYLVFLFLLRFLPSFSLVIQHAKQAFYSCYCFPCRFFFAVEKVNKNDKIVLFSKIIHGIQVFHNYLVVCLKIFKKFSTAISTANVAKFGN